MVQACELESIFVRNDNFLIIFLFKFKSSPVKNFFKLTSVKVIKGKLTECEFDQTFFFRDKNWSKQVIFNFFF